MPRFVTVSMRIFEYSSEFSYVYATIPANVGVDVGLKLFLSTSDEQVGI